MPVQNSTRPSSFVLVIETPGELLSGPPGIEFDVAWVLLGDPQLGKFACGVCEQHVRTRRLKFDSFIGIRRKANSQGKLHLLCVDVTPLKKYESYHFPSWPAILLQAVQTP